MSAMAEGIRRFHDSPARVAMTLTGGAGAVAQLLTTPGASRTMLEVQIPYATEALDALLGGRPDRYCSPETARAMAMTAFQRARRWTPAAGGQRPPLWIGLGCTASLASDRPKRGPHRAHLAVQTSETTHTRTLHFRSDRTRFDEEGLLAAAIVELLCETAGLPTGGPQGDFPDAREAIDDVRTVAAPERTALLLGQRAAVRQGPVPAPADNARSGAAIAGGGPTIFPGAFHPRHDGHRQMAELAAARLGRPVEHEISIVNVEKPPLDFWEMESRAAQFGSEETLWLTAAPTFVEKARQFPGATFVVGADTIVRIGQPKYYSDSLGLRDRAIDELAELGIRFLVFCRATTAATSKAGTASNSGTRELRRLGDLGLPPALLALCEEVPPEEFRRDVSSTELRSRARRADDA